MDMETKKKRMYMKKKNRKTQSFRIEFFYLGFKLVSHIAH